MIERTLGKLTVKTYITQNHADQHGRQAGKWVTLVTQHGLDYTAAEHAAKQFAEYNQQFADNISAEWIPYPQHIFID